MKRCNRILRTPAYIRAMEENKRYDAGRKFCGHDMNHLLDTARIGYLMILEQELAIPKEIIYAAALLHDAGRFKEDEGQCHDLASARLAADILPGCGFEPEEIQQITEAIAGHREPAHDGGSLTDILYRADKLSSPVSEECNWPEEKKNHLLEL